MTKEDFRRMIDIKHTIANLKERQLELLDAATNVSPVLTGMPHGGAGNDKFASYAEKVDELNRKILEKTIELEAMRLEADEVIDGLPTVQQQRVMKYRYIEGLSMWKISKVMHYDLSGIYKIEKAAFAYLGFQ